MARKKVTTLTESRQRTKALEAVVVERLKADTKRHVADKARLLAQLERSEAEVATLKKKTGGRPRKKLPAAPNMLVFFLQPGQWSKPKRSKPGKPKDHKRASYHKALLEEAAKRPGTIPKKTAAMLAGMTDEQVEQHFKASRTDALPILIAEIRAAVKERKKAARELAKTENRKLGANLQNVFRPLSTKA